MISQTAEYALRAVLHLAQHADDIPVSVDAVAEALEIPRNYLSKILHTLAKSGVLTSHRGPRGGFNLSVPSAELCLLDVINPFDRVSERRLCLLGRKECSDATPCPAHHRWRAVSDQVSDFFSDTTIEQFLAEGMGEEAN